MNDLTLNILQPGELVIPDLMAKSNLTLAEIGIIYLFFASKADILEDPRLTSKAGKAACESLKKRGVLKVELVKIADKNSRLKIQLDLDKVKVTP